MSLPWGVRTFSIQRDLILLSGAPTCLWHRLTNFTNSNQKRLDFVLKSSTKSSRDQFKTQARSQASFFVIGRCLLDDYQVIINQKEI
jgi:hypothetical protein